MVGETGVFPLMPAGIYIFWDCSLLDSAMDTTNTFFLRSVLNPKKKMKVEPTAGSKNALQVSRDKQTQRTFRNAAHIRRKGCVL